MNGNTRPAPHASRVAVVYSQQECRPAVSNCRMHVRHHTIAMKRPVVEL